MAAKDADAIETVGPVDDEKVLETSVADEMRDSFLEYALSVIVSRALPDVRDGLKPVHRRLLYSMYDDRYLPTGGYKKCAKIVGRALGSFHPHGDSSVYMALARMAQPWSLNVPVVDGHGNFGSLGGEDPPAAMRYTEAKLDKAAMPLVEELGEDTVDFVDNYDGSEQEPDVLPAGFPFLLTNGSEGIAVGMRTNIPPHNLGEVIAACKLVAAAKLEGTLPSLDEIMAVLPGPDFPTGATVVGTEGVRELYATGAGRFSIRAKAKVEQIGPRSQGIIITELPFSIGPEKIFDKMKQLIRDKKLDGISAADTKNLTDRRTGLKLQIGIKTGFNPAAVLERLYGSTHLEQTFSGQLVALVDGQPKQLTLVEMLDHYVAHRLDVVRRRTEYRKRKAEARLHIVDGLLTALGDIDTVVKIIRGSKNTDTARKNLIKKMDLTEVQASHILEMPLRRLTSMEVGKLKAEKAELEQTIAELEQLLGSPQRMTDQVIEELDAVGEQFGGERRSKLVGADRVPKVDTSEVEIPDEPCVVTLSTSGLIGRGDEEFTNKHGRHDLILQRIATSTRATVYAFTNTGRVLPVAVAAIPKLEGRSRGGAVTEFFHTERGERIVGISVLEAKGAGVALATADGMIKRILPTDVGVGTRGGVTPGVTVMGFREATDEVIGVVDVPGSEDGASDAELVLVTAQAQLLRFKADTVRPQGRSGGGVNGIKFKDDDEFAKVIALGVVPPDSVDQLDLVTRSDAGLLKVTAVGDYPTKGRYGQGVRCHKLLKDDTHLAGANVVAGVPGAMIEGTPEPLESFRAKRDASGEDFGAAPEAVGSLR